jgi:hypothetical protein
LSAQNSRFTPVKSVHNTAPMVLIQACDNHTASTPQNLFHHVEGG